MSYTIYSVVLYLLELMLLTAKGLGNRRIVAEGYCSYRNFLLMRDTEHPVLRHPSFIIDLGDSRRDIVM